MPEVPHDATVALRLELGRMTDKANALEAALRKEVLAVVGRSVAQATYDSKQDVESAGLEVKALADENARLKAEVERLRKAGDMCDQLLACFEMEGRKGVNIGRDMWNAAKEGKQP